ncbi:MAG: hypothetical protein WCH76_06565 [Candidatus Riflemargulisbacteria bacterium]
MIKNRVVSLVERVSNVPFKKIGVVFLASPISAIPITINPNPNPGNDVHNLNHSSNIAEKAREKILTKLIVVEDLLAKAEGAKSVETRKEVLDEINESGFGNNDTELSAAIINLQHHKRKLEVALGHIKLD